MSRPLEHITVLDLSRILAGPMCTQTLADLGATVIKVEQPGVGDDTRQWGPPFVHGEDGQRVAAYFLSANRAKKSVTIDFSQNDGRDLVLEIAKKADVVVENFKTGGLEKYGLHYKGIQQVNSSIIYCSITGFGHSGPYKDRVGYDFMIQGMSGLMSITGESDDSPGGGPVKVGVAVSDLFSGLYSVVGILAALQHRDRTGEGQHIDISLFDSQVAVLANQALNYLTTGDAPQRLGNAHPNIVPYEVFKTSDGHLILAVGNDRQFEKLCVIVGCPEIAAHADFKNNADRVKNRNCLVDLLSPLIRGRKTNDWIVVFQNAGVPSGPINDIEQMFADPQILSRNLKVEINHPGLGALPSVACPIKYSGTPLSYNHPPPLLGEHMHEILSEYVDLTDEKIAEYKRSGII